MKYFALTLALITAAASLTACNTISGLGEDVQAVGGAVTDASEGATSGSHHHHY